MLSMSYLSKEKECSMYTQDSAFGNSYEMLFLKWQDSLRACRDDFEPIWIDSNTKTQPQQNPSTEPLSH